LATPVFSLLIRRGGLAIPLLFVNKGGEFGAGVNLRATYFALNIAVDDSQ
jgi:hypothetical protein